MGAPATSEIEARLRQALIERAVTLHYQPIVTLPSARPVAVEALARWTDPTLGELPPDSFIPVAESTGLIHTLGNHVLGLACHATAAWPVDVEIPIRVSVNVSPLQLANDTFVWQVAAALEESGLQPHRLVLEITESAALKDMAESAARLHALRSLGVRIALDDFGVGHSPLNMLRQLPLDVLKIDRSFVARVHENARDAVVARLLIDTAHTLGLSVCGEGVETREQARQLMALGCDTAQGWYFGRPQAPSEALDAVLHPPPGELERRLDITVPAPIQIGSDELVTIADPDATILYASPGSLAVVGYTPSELIGSSAAEHLHPDEAQEILSTPDAEVSERAAVRVHRVRHRDGSYRWLNTRTQMLRDQHGLPHQVVSTSRDVTPQVDTELQLASTEATLRWAFDQSPIGLALSDFDGVIVRCNQAFAGMLGYSAEDVIGRKVAELTHPDDQAADEANLRHLLEDQDGTQRVEKRYVHAAGYPVTARVWATTLADESGDPAYVVAHILPMEAL